jgi:hypothetical protein
MSLNTLQLTQGHGILLIILITDFDDDARHNPDTK